MLDVLKNIIQWLGEALSWLVEFAEWLVTKIFLGIFEAVIFVLSAIPVPDWLADISTNALSIDPGVLFFIAPLEITTGVTWIVSAYLLRFLIRRIPVIG